MVYVFQEKLFIRLLVVSSLLKFAHSTMIYGSVSDTFSSSTYVRFAVSQSEFRFVIILTDVIGFRLSDELFEGAPRETWLPGCPEGKKETVA